MGGRGMGYGVSDRLEITGISNVLIPGKKPPKKLSHRQIGFAITKINGRIEYHWRAVGQGAPVTGPKISVQ